jgi:hypothetical protein
MKDKGLLINDDYDLKLNIQRNASNKITSGLLLGNTLYQNQALILILQAGELKLNPIVGVGIENIVADNDVLAWRKNIRQQMELDGQKVKEVSFDKDLKLKLDAAYR